MECVGGGGRSSRGHEREICAVPTHPHGQHFTSHHPTSYTCCLYTLPITCHLTWATTQSTDGHTQTKATLPAVQGHTTWQRPTIQAAQAPHHPPCILRPAHEHHLARCNDTNALLAGNTEPLQEEQQRQSSSTATAADVSSQLICSQAVL